MKEVVLKLDLHDCKGKRKAMKAVATLGGIVSIAIDLKDSKLTVIGEVDPIEVVKKLKKKRFFVEILTVRSKEKKPEDKKIDAYQAYYPYYLPTHYPVMTIAENPSACVIC